jgi:2-methylcitrate dehydratase PrpD
MSVERTLADQFADFVINQRFEEIPEVVLMRAKLLMLDAVGIAYASSQQEFAQRTLNALATFGDGDGRVIGMPAKLALRDAVLLNGLLIHGLDYDDTYLPGSVHLSSSCASTALGMAASVGASGRALLVAYVLGLEIGARLGAAGSGAFLRAGFHATSMAGTFASTLIASRLMDMTRAQAVMAQGVALSTVSGTMQPMQDGSWTKRMHPGWSGVCGITAATLAKQGFVGPTEPYEGRFGLFTCFLGEHTALADLSMATNRLAEHWEFQRTSIKLFPVCHQSHAFMNAAIKIGRAHAIDAAQVASIHVLVAAPAVPLICEPLAEKRRPDSSYAAQFSLPYNIACCLMRGSFGMAELAESSYGNPQMRDLASKMTYAIDPNSGFPKTRSGEVLVTMNNGEVYQCREEINPDEPADAESIITKFMDNAAMAIAPARAKTVRDLILGLEEVADARAVMRLLSGGFD